jgi:ectoine hydroxylase-related dioxygenase (phytanoyl-CoA dioxygenase family)
VGATTHTSPVLSEQQVADFERDGYLILDDPCESALVDAIAEEFDERFREDFHPGPRTVRDGVMYAMHPALRGDYHWQRILNAWKISDTARAAALAPRVLAALEQIYGRKPMPFQTLNFPVGTQQAAHSDGGFFNSDPAGFMCGVWIALEDVDMDNGPLFYHPGSHRLATPTAALVEAELGESIDPTAHGRDQFRAERDRLYSTYTRRVAEVGGFDARHATIRKGQAMIWAANLLHGGAVHKNHERTRRSQVTHYLFEDCRFTRPIWAEGDRNWWDYPTWIREPVPDLSRAAVKRAFEASTLPGSTVLVMTNDPELPHLDGRQGIQLSVDPSDGSHDGQAVGEWDPVTEVRGYQEAGARYLAIANTHIWALQYTMPELAQQLEQNGDRATLRDGAYGVVFEL